MQTLIRSAKSLVLGLTGQESIGVVLDPQGLRAVRLSPGPDEIKVSQSLRLPRSPGQSDDALVDRALRSLRVPLSASLCSSGFVLFVAVSTFLVWNLFEDLVSDRFLPAVGLGLLLLLSVVRLFRGIIDRIEAVVLRRCERHADALTLATVVGLILWGTLNLHQTALSVLPTLDFEFRIGFGRLTYPSNRIDPRTGKAAPPLRVRVSETEILWGGLVVILSAVGATAFWTPWLGVPLRRLARELRGCGCPVAVAVDGRTLSVRRYDDLPPAAPRDLRQALAMRLSRDLPGGVDRSDLVFAVQATEEAEKSRSRTRCGVVWTTRNQLPQVTSETNGRRSLVASPLALVKSIAVDPSAGLGPDALILQSCPDGVMVLFTRAGDLEAIHPVSPVSGATTLRGELERTLRMARRNGADRPLEAWAVADSEEGLERLLSASSELVSEVRPWPTPRTPSFAGLSLDLVAPALVAFSVVESPVLDMDPSVREGSLATFDFGEVPLASTALVFSSVLLTGLVSWSITDGAFTSDVAVEQSLKDQTAIQQMRRPKMAGVSGSLGRNIASRIDSVLSSREEVDREKILHGVKKTERSRPIATVLCRLRSVIASLETMGHPIVLENLSIRDDRTSLRGHAPDARMVYRLRQRLQEESREFVAFRNLEVTGVVNRQDRRDVAFELRTGGVP